MKKLILIYTLLLFGFVNAQSIKYGVTASFHKGSIAEVHGVSKGNFGGNIGVFADFSLVPNDIYDSAWLYFTPQLEFYTIGERADWNEDGQNKQKYNNYYVAVPLYIKYFLKNHGYKSDIYFMFGPKFEFLASEKTEEGNAVAEAKAAGLNPNTFGLGQKMDTFGYGVSVKAGAKINDKLDVFIRFDRGLSKVYPDYRDATYNRFLAIGVSYYLGETN
ncbi:outer membrane beta-barrel protein [Epilithonimonas sp. UC225_85]|uniref:outer membrane beta-barrel protein n=1 Tax=Epilithonimonas sp. UC225_85 TaxID=3350167 RepID=UPI0036D3AFB6